MLTIKNALAYVWRKKIKTLIIFLILLAISTLTLGSIAVKNATDAASKETFKNKEVGIYAQDVSQYENGAYTGEISANMLKSLD